MYDSFYHSDVGNRHEKEILHIKTIIWDIGFDMRQNWGEVLTVYLITFVTKVWLIQSHFLHWNMEMIVRSSAFMPHMAVLIASSSTILRVMILKVIPLFR